MKYWRGYLTAAIFAVLTWALISFSKAHSVLVDMIYPYATRLIQTSLAAWTSGADFLIWQLLVVVLGVLLLASIVVMIVLKWNPIQWFGWVLAVACFLGFLHTGIYGMNSNAGPLADDIRLDVTIGSGTVTELAEATKYYRDMANALSDQVPRDSGGNLDYPTFEDMALQAGEGYETLTYDYALSVFAGSTLPVKKLGWADLYTSMGISGVTMPLTGEAAVNPQIPVVEMPFTMCHEMAHRMCIALERDANLAAFLSCRVNSDPIYQYSGYFMAFRYCYNALASVGTSTANNAAKEIYDGIGSNLKKDLTDYRAFYAANMDEKASNVANTVNDTYIKASGDESGITSYGQVCDLLVSWYIQEIYMPEHVEEEVVFDPFDKNQVDLSGIPNAEGK
ncbi:MAG: DUF3810 domain-containing protein [Faecousia sp.]